MTVPPAVLSAVLPLLHTAEGLVLHAYQDSVGVWTIGWGHTGPDVHAGLVWTQEQADASLAQTLASLYAQLQTRLSPVWLSLSPTRQAAILDWTYNLGIGQLLGSTLYKKIQSGLLNDVPAEISKWIYAGGHILAGLVKRRAAEVALWNTSNVGTYMETTGIMIMRDVQSP